MPKRSRKPSDLNQLAARIVADSTSEEPTTTQEPKAKDPAAVALGRRGGLKGGKARMADLTTEQRSELAKKAAAARWGDKSKGGS
jgi:hypothetical protein